jgi:hypothetical protein
VRQVTDSQRITRGAQNRDCALSALLCVACVWLGACRGSTADRAARARSQQQALSAPASAKVTAPGGSLGQVAAFELVATSEGALLIWVPPAVCERGLRVQRLDADGNVQPGSPTATIPACATARAGAVTELSAAAGGGRLGVAWILEAAGQAQVLGTHGGDAAEAFAPVLPLGAAEAGPRAPQTQRGRLWMVASESGQLRVAWHAPRVACAGEAGTCAQLVSEAHPPAVEAAGRRTDVREIPHPCPRLLVGSVWTQGVWYDAFCALGVTTATDQQSTTHVYAIRPEIFYAEADPVLRDCEPLGLSPSRTGAVAWGRCRDGLRAHTLAPEGRRQLDGATRSASCEAGRPVLRVRGQSGQGDSLVLDAPRERLELWLPPELASEGGRAVFTGRRLLVAWARGDHLVVQSLRCQGRALVSEPAPML